MVAMTTITDRFGETVTVGVDHADGGVTLSADVLLSADETRALVDALTNALDSL